MTFLDIDVFELASTVRRRLQRYPEIVRLLSEDSRIPHVVHGSGRIRLIVVGQDPTRRNQKVQHQLATVFNWDKRGSMKGYISRICRGLDLDVNSDVYGTNLMKCFFSRVITEDLKSDERLASIMKFEWLPLLRREVAEFPEATIISLGEPTYRLLCRLDVPPLRVRWGFQGTHKEHRGFSHVEADVSELDRPFFPFPHVQTVNMDFYRRTFSDYLAFFAQESS